MNGLNSLVEDYWNCAEYLREYARENNPVSKKLIEMDTGYEGSVADHLIKDNSGYTAHGREAAKEDNFGQ